MNEGKQYIGFYRSNFPYKTLRITPSSVKVAEYKKESEPISRSLFVEKQFCFCATQII